MPKLLVSGRVQLGQLVEPVEVRRGMTILAQCGERLGIVAAIVLDGRSQVATHLLLSFVPPTALYHLIPLNLIKRIEDEIIWLQLLSRDLARLPAYQPGKGNQRIIRMERQ